MSDGSVLGTISRYLTGVERVLIAISSMTLFIMMWLMVCDALGRYLFAHPILGTIEVTEMYLLGVLAFFPLASLYNHDEHVAIASFQARFSPGVKLVFDLFNSVMALIVFGVICFKSTQMSLQNFIDDRETSGLIMLPIWWGWAIAGIGSGALCLRIIVKTLEKLPFFTPREGRNVAAETGGRN